MLQSFRYFNVCFKIVTLEMLNQSKSADVFKNDGLEVTQQRLFDQSGHSFCQLNQNVFMLIISLSQQPVSFHF